MRARVEEAKRRAEHSGRSFVAVRQPTGELELAEVVVVVVAATSLVSTPRRTGSAKRIARRAPERRGATRPTTRRAEGRVTRNRRRWTNPGVRPRGPTTRPARPVRDDFYLVFVLSESILILPGTKVCVLHVYWTTYNPKAGANRRAHSKEEDETNAGTRVGLEWDGP